MAVSRISNVITSTTTGDTITGPLTVYCVKGVGGTVAGTIQLSVGLQAGGSQQVYFQQVAANTTPPSDNTPFRLGGNQTMTITLTGTGTTVHLYVE